ncbi:PQQ-like beta-propeller repeat protein [Parapedobacter tibetensis]|uniref:PQQ-like beta-propeller repeat protein n=1 Tax=Parapedobacter tibetensis TaxID=2972951 RepID=UPI00214DE643|nr:PQQ-like beta-propeller repeat protein [Parapedobacter tibetensis]
MKISSSALFVLGLSRMRNTIIVTSVLFIAVIVASVLYFADLKQGDQSKRKLFTHVPEDAVFLVSFQNDEVLDDIFSGFDIFKAMLGDAHFQQLTDIREQVLRHELISAYTHGEEIALSFHPSKAQIDYLMALPANKSLTIQTLFNEVETIDAGFNPEWMDSLQQQLFRMHLPDGKQSLYVAEHQGVLFASFSADLINRATDDTSPKLPDAAITYFRQGNNGNSPLTWYINHERLFDFAGSLMANKPGDFVRLLEGLSGYSTLRMNFKSDALMFSGSSTLEVDSTQYLSLYSQQQPIEQTLKNIVPATTATYISFGISDFIRLHDGITNLLTTRKEIAQMREQHRLIRHTAKVSIQEELLPEWGNEFAVLELANRETLAIIKVKDSLSFANTIQRISTPYPANLYRLNHSNLLYYSFGDPLKAFTRPYFLLIDQYMICANHTSTLRRFETEYAQQKTLASTLGYINFDRLQANRANVAVFVNNENASNTIARGLKAPFEAAYTDEAHFGYQKFYAWSFQLSGSSGGFFSNFYAKYADTEAPGATPEWTFDLHGRPVAGPMVLDYDHSSKFILVQASNHILYAVSPDGQQLWNAQLPGPILGRVHQLADSSIILTTAQRLYRIDTGGNPLPGFSLQLPHGATSSATVFEDGEDIRLFVPAKNRILAYDARGKILPGWENKTVTGDILFDLKSTHVDDINYVIAGTDAGRFYFFNYNGQLVQLTEAKTRTDFQNPIGLYTLPDEPSSSWIATTDTAGMLTTISFEQQQSRKVMGQWSASHTFDTENITDNRLPEFVFTDNGQLSVYRYQDSSLVYHYDFGQRIALRPQFFRTTSGTHQIGIATAGNGLLYVFNPDGTLVDGFPTTGSPYFYFGKLHSDNRAYLICSKNDRKLHVYQY